MSKKKMTFEEALGRLEEIVRQLEDGQLPLEKALEVYAEGVEVGKFCQSALDEAEKRIMVLTAPEGGKPILKEMGGI